MRRVAPLLVLLACACDKGQPPQRPAPQNVVQPAPVPSSSPAPAGNEANAVETAPSDVPPPGDPGLAGLSPSQRRAYELGYRDCSHGRYAPDNHLEAYRIGCGAAHDRMDGSARRDD
jgi:hypothetical protein